MSRSSCIVRTAIWLIAFWLGFAIFAGEADAANRFWVGGNAAWNGTAGSKWALTSGGAGGQAEPTTSDLVIFDSNDGAGGAATVTVTGNRQAGNVTFTGGTGNFTGTLAGASSPSISWLGNMTLSPGMTMNSGMTLVWLNTFATSTATLTTNGITFGTLQLGDAVTLATATLTLQDDLNLAGVFRSTTNGGQAKGTFVQNGKHITTQSMTDGTGGIASYSFDGTITLTGTGTVVSIISPITTGASGLFDLTDTSGTSRTVTYTNSGPMPMIKPHGAANTVLGSSGQIAGVDLSASTGQFDSGVTMSGNVTMSASATINSVGSWTFGGSGSYTLTSAGFTFTRPVVVNSTGTWTLQDNFAVSSASGVTLTAGTFDLNSHNVSSALVSTSNSNVRRVKSTGVATITLTGTGTAWDSSTATSLTVDSATVIKYTDNSATGKTFAGGGGTFGTLWDATLGAGTLTITGADHFTDLKIDPTARAVVLPASTTIVATTIELSGALSNQNVYTSSSSGTAATLSVTVGSFCETYVSLKDSTATGGATFAAGVGSTNVSGNTGWTFGTCGSGSPLPLVGVGLG